jgi:predicted ferric reductase
MRKEVLRANLITYVLSFFPVFILILEKPSVISFSTIYSTFTSLAKIAGLAGIGLMSFNVLLSSRNSLIDKLYGGLDTVYLVHHDKGKIAFIVLLLHPTFLAARLLEDSILAALLYILPSNDVAVNLGKIALVLMSIAILISLYIKLEYEKLRKIHKTLGIYLLLGAVHSFLTGSDISYLPILEIYVYGLVFLAVFSHLNTSWFNNFLSKKFLYRVDQVDQLSDTITEIRLLPEEDIIEFKPGQFIFPQFDQDGLKERHPFSITSSVIDNFLTLNIKKLGDFTGKISTLKKGTKVKVEGPYGGFSYLKGGYNQIWVAGGIGITPLLSMATSLDSEEKYKIHIYHSIRDEGDKVLVNKMNEIIEPFENIIYNVIDTKTSPRITSDQVLEQSKELDNPDIYICGPINMIKDISSQFKNKKIPKEKIHIEYFKLL